MSWELGQDGGYHLVLWIPYLGKVTTPEGRQIPTPPRVEPPPPHLQRGHDTVSQTHVPDVDMPVAGTAAQAPAVEATSTEQEVGSNVSSTRAGRWRSQPSVTPQTAEPLPGATAGGGRRLSGKKHKGELPVNVMPE